MIEAKRNGNTLILSDRGVTFSYSLIENGAGIDATNMGEAQMGLFNKWLKEGEK